MDNEPTLEELEALEADLDLDIELEDLEDDDDLLLDSDRYVSLDELQEDEYANDGSYYKSLGIQWDEVE